MQDWQALEVDCAAIKNITLFDPSFPAPQTGTAVIENGVFKTLVGPEQSFGDTFEIIDLSSADQPCWLVPGFVDIGAYLCEPGFEHKGTLLSESKAAFRTGFSHIAMMPDTDPIIDSPAVVGLIHEKAKCCPIDISPIAAMTKNLAGEQLSEIFALQNAGCIGVTQSRAPLPDLRLKLRCLEYIATTDLTVFFYPQNSQLAGAGYAHEGAIADRLGFTGIPECAETHEIASDLLLIEATGVPAHFGRISSARGLELIEHAQQRGLPVTADVALTHLALTEHQLLGFDSMFHLIPPLRTQTDRKALLDGVNRGVLAISTGHEPQDIASKNAPFAEAKPGMAIYDTHFALALDLIQRGELEPLAWAKSFSLMPKQILGLTATSNADFTLLQPQNSWQVDKRSCLSTAGNIAGFGHPQLGVVRLRIKGLA